jgi:DNA-binding NarL/FixJ family response regulator/signal transduction histidine kinase
MTPASARATVRVMQRIRDLWQTDRGRFVHYLVAAALASFVLVELSTFDAMSAVVAGAALTVVVALLFTRDAPFVAPLVVLAGFAVIVWDAGAAAQDLGSPFFVVVFFIPWSLGAYNTLRRAVAGLLAAEALGVWANVQFENASFSDFFFISLLIACSWAAGVFVGSRSEHAREMAERARRLELEQKDAAERAVAQERQRIARELHDVIAHSVSVMTVQTGAVRRLLLPEQEKERQALETVEATGREALTEMRRLVGLLREQGATPEFSPQPGLGTMGDLLDTVRSAGLPVELAVDGTPRELPPGIDLAAYRVVQEALTNALKYGGTAHAWVSLHWRDDELELEVANDGKSDGDGSGGGHGLAGMRERVSLYGGTLDSGPRDGGGFVVRARLPVAQVTALPSGLVSFLMSDIERSTDLVRQLGRERYEELLRDHRTIISAAVEEFGGRIVDSQGDSTFAVFGRASDAVRAAARAQHDLEVRDWPDDVVVRVRMGIHTGEATPSGDTYHGLAVHRAARICAEAKGGHVLVSHATVSVIEDARDGLGGVSLVEVGERRLKDFEQPVRLHRLESAAGDEEAGGPSRIGILIADDQALVRTGFRMILEAERDLDIVGEASDGAEAVEQARRTKPDVILMDVRMPNVDGLEATRRLLDGTEQGPRVLILTTFDLDEYVYEALKAGASGFLLKDTPPEELVDAIHVVARGDALLAPSITRRVIEEFVRRPPQSVRASAKEVEELTTRELEMLQYVARGLSNAEIAKEAFVSETTVKTHVAHILMKLHLRDRVQAVVFAYENGVVAAGG